MRKTRKDGVITNLTAIVIAIIMVLSPLSTVVYGIETDVDLGLSLGLSGSQQILMSSIMSKADVLSETRQKKLMLWYDEPANIAINNNANSDVNWQQNSLPIGNGYQGANIFGGISTERIQLSEESLWTGGPVSGNGVATYPSGNYIGMTNKYGNELDPNDYYAARDAALGNDNTAITAIMEDKLLTDTRKALGGAQNFSEVYLDFEHNGNSGIQLANTVNYERNLDINRSIAGVEYTHDNVTYNREYFASYPEHIVAVSLSASESGKVSFTLRPTIPHKTAGSGSGHFTPADYGKVGKVTAIDSNTIEIDGYLRQNGLRFAAQFKVINTGGSLTHANDASSDNGTITVSGADSVIILISYGTDYVNDYGANYRTGQEPLIKVRERINSAVTKGYSAVKYDHIRDYQELFDRVIFDLGQAPSIMPTDELLAKYKSTKDQLALEELYFQYGRYLLISSSREGNLPAHLQGVWNAYEFAPWQSDYHFNINLQMNYWPATNTNLLETAKPLVEYVDSIREPGREAAKAFGVPSGPGEENGWVLMISNNPFGFVGMTNPLSRNASGYATWSTGSTAWIAQNVYDYYQVSGDKAYLETEIYPTLRETAAFFKTVLINDPNSGRMVISPSYSSEHGPMLAGTTFDQELVWQLFKDTIEAAEALGLDTGADATFIEEIKTLKDQLDPLHINPDNGRIKEWYQEETFTKNTNGEATQYGIDPRHRHISHLVGLYPGNHITADTPEFMDAAKLTLDGRGDGGTGWAMGHKMNLWARLQDGERTYKLFQNLLTNGTYNNLWDAHPPFQIDGNFGGTAGVAEMTMQSYAGYIEPLPAIPSAWADGSMIGLTAEGGFVVDLKWSNQKLDVLTITSKVGNDCTVLYEDIKDATIVNSDGEEVVFTVSADESRITFPTEAGVSYTIVVAENFALEELLKSAKELYAVNYTRDSYEALETAIIKAEEYLVGASSLTLKETQTLLEAGIIGLILRTDINSTEIEETVNIAKAIILNESDYDTSTIADLKNAADDAIAVLNNNIGTQQDIDDAVANLVTAIQNLQQLPVGIFVNNTDTSIKHYHSDGTLNSTIDNTGTNNKWYRYVATKYTSGNVTVNRNAGAYIEYVFDGTGISYVTETALEGSLVDIYIDGSAVRQDIDVQSSVQGGLARQVVFEQQGLTNGSHTIKIVSTAVSPSNPSGRPLVRLEGFYVYGTGSTTVNKDALRIAMIDIKQANYSDYANSVWEEMKTAYSNSLAKMASISTTASDITSQVNKINNLLAQTSNFSFEPLDKAIMSAQKAIEGKYKSEFISGYSELKAEIERAKGFRKIANSATSEASINAAVAALNNAITNLVPISTLPALDYTVLDAKISEVEAFVNACNAEDFEAGYGELVATLESCKLVRVSATTQIELNNAVADLNNAIDNLVLVKPETIDLEEIKVKITNFLNSYQATNAINKTGLEAVVSKLIPAGVKLSLNEFKLKPATTEDSGSATATITISADGNSVVIQVDLPIKQLEKPDPPVISMPSSSGGSSSRSTGSSKQDISPNILGEQNTQGEQLKPLNKEQLISNIKTAITSAKTSSLKTAVVKIRNTSNLTVSAIKELQQLSKNESMELVLHADTTLLNSSVVQGRVTVNPNKLNSDKEIMLGVYTQSSLIDQIKALFAKYFKNDIAVVDLKHQGDFGATVRIAVKYNSDKLNTSNLKFYAYDCAANKYMEINNTQYKVSGEYIYFDTQSGGAIIISDGELAKI